MPVPWVAFDRVVLATAIVSTAVLFTEKLADPVNVIKMTALALCAIALLASCAARAVRLRVLQLPWGLPAAAGVALLVAFVIATINAPVTTTAVLGTYGRNSGLLTYASALTLFLVGLRVLDRGGTRFVLYGLMLAGAFTATYGLLQYAGLDSVDWANPLNPIIGAMGNPNFAAAYVAICTPAAAWGALRTGWTLPWRVISAVFAALSLLAALLSNAAQGPLAAAPGLAVLAVAWLLDQRAEVRRWGLLTLGLVTTLGLLVLGAGLAGAGPAAGVFSDIGARARGWYWEAAVTIWKDAPVFGVGLDTFGSFWRSAQPLGAVRERGGELFTDAAHSVPLHLLATGGLVLGLTYVAFVALTATALVAGLRRLQGQDRLLLGALGGCWTAYQVQSLVSIDQVPLIVTQYVLAAGVIVAAGWASLREVRLSGARPVNQPAQHRRRKRGGAVVKPRPRPLVGADYAALALVGVVALALAWQVLVPLRANAAARDGDLALSIGDARAALAAYDDARSLLPGEPRYWQKKGVVYQQANQTAQALQAFRRAADIDPFDVASVRQVALLAEEQGQVDEAQRLYRRAVELDPYGPNTVLPAATFELRNGDAAEAAAWLERVVEALPRQAALWAALGDARAATGDVGLAREAYQQALVLEPGQPSAAAGVVRLQQSTAG